MVSAKSILCAFAFMAMAMPAMAQENPDDISFTNNTDSPTTTTTPGIPDDKSLTIDTDSPTTTPVDSTKKPTTAPTKKPTRAPTAPTKKPTRAPTKKPTAAPTKKPTTAPTNPPTSPPTNTPTEKPTAAPTNPPSNSPTNQPTEAPTKTPTAAPTNPPTSPPTNALTIAPTPVGSGTGDPHFKTWSGSKFDYHGECDLVLVDNPHFANGLGLKVHVRTTHIQYFSFIEKVAVKIGEDVLEFSNNVANVTLNGVVAAVKEGKRKIFMADKYEVVRYKKNVIIRLDKANGAKIDLIVRRVGWPSVKIEAGNTHVLDGSLGLLGEYTTGKKLARDGVTEMNDEDATVYALEWQVRDLEPSLFSDARVPQYPDTCIAPAKMMGNRLGLSLAKKEAEKVCAAWGDDIDDCIFDVIASRNILSAEKSDE